MSVHKRTWKSDGKTKTAWRVRWEDATGWQSKTFDRKGDADAFDAELTRRRRLGTLAQLDAGQETLDAYMAETWVPTFGALIAPQTRRTYAALYATHLAPTFGPLPLRDITTELVSRWQSDRLSVGTGPVAVRQSLGLLGNVLQRAVEAQRIVANPVRNVRKAKMPKRAEVRPLAPASIEAMRAAASDRDAMLISLLAYAGLRPGEALALQWGDVRENTLIVQRAASLGELRTTKTGQHRTVRLLEPLARDLAEWRMRCGRPADSALVIPGADGKPWSEEAFKRWRRRSFARLLSIALGGIASDPTAQACPKCKAVVGKPCRTPGGQVAASSHAERRRVKVKGRPYDLRHSFASLLLHEGRSVIYVARQLGHGAQLTLSTYGHTIDELEDSPNLDAEAAIAAARSSCAAHRLPIASAG